ncbi:capsular biosynthesis protein [Bacillus cereus]|nr:capsular biosynthesis protein [Bacillus cereus]PFJ48745.1 capsular biosynthesis protein [Bacillus cereus]PFK05254.1 capsular biosynthesis protein [Bacillus cereus]PFW19776.1 capsular biosynthesis protein [Bacillus cereus]PGM85790.1 capsular biosynthesis protein [Bacillus cereus]
MKKILLLDTSVATLNMGDDIINISIKNNMEELLKDNYYITMPTHTPLFYKYQNLLYPKKLDIYKNADYKFLCGTNALYTNMLRPLPNWNIHLFNTKLVQNTILFGVGIGENSKNINLYTKTLYKKVLSKEYVHSTRDEKTKVMLENMGFKAENTGCPTLWKLTPEFCKEIPTTKRESVIFTLTYYHKDIPNDIEMIKILKRSYKKVYFWPQCALDLDYLKELGESEGVTIISPNLENYDAILSEDIDYVGNRLHGGVFALQHKKRAIIIAIDYRAREMKKNYSIPVLDRENIVEELEGKISSEWRTEITGLDFDKIEKWKKQF